jgi:protein TonB
MIRFGEAVFFLTLATGAHLGLWALAPGTDGATSAGGPGEDKITLSAATPAQAAMIEAWQRPPDIAAGPQPLSEGPAVADTSPVVLPRPMSQTQRPVFQPTAMPSPQAPALPVLDSGPPSPPMAKNESIAEVRPKSRPLRKQLSQTAEASENRQQQRAKGSAQGEQRAADGNSKLASQTAARTNALRAEWGSAIYAQVRRNMRFPRGVDQGGTAKVALRIASNGVLTDLRLTRSSGNDALDKAALRAVSQAGRFARAPNGLPGAEHAFSLSLTFAP